MFKVGFMITFVGPLVLVLSLNMLKEACDDLKRRARDKQLNNETYDWLNPKGSDNDPSKRYKRVKAKNLKVGMIIKLEQGRRVPADMVLLSTSSKSASVFIKTDQLDGETDWKQRKSVPAT
mmetsp:Transcript_20838/g.14948  ORF Transcript_20838/g.14948 Transcript_20838/m.14948 type:complete len:121 (-) Transcript_20838:2608-2970(-)